jgi:hypothetical protein
MFENNLDKENIKNNSVVNLALSFTEKDKFESLYYCSSLSNSRGNNKQLFQKLENYWIM